MTASISKILTHATQSINIFSISTRHASRALHTLLNAGYCVYPCIGSWNGKMENSYIVVDNFFLTQGLEAIKEYMVDQEAIMLLTRTGLRWQATVYSLPYDTDKPTVGRHVGEFKSVYRREVWLNNWTYCPEEDQYYIVD